jgi:hypothetical protein
MTRQVTTVAILLIVQGVIDLTTGLTLCVVALYVATGRTGLQLEMFPLPPQIGVLVFGPLLTAAGLLKLVAGIRNYSCRGHLLGILALASSLVSAVLCYCAPTSLILMTWGLILYRRPEVERAFLMGRQGLSREWIRASLDGRSPRA